MIHKEIDVEHKLQKYAFFGFLLFFLSAGLLTYTTYYISAVPGILGESTGSPGSGESQQPGSESPIREPSQTQLQVTQEPSSPPEPTTRPVQMTTLTPTPIPQPTTIIIEIEDPEEELHIENEDSTLIVKKASDKSEVIRIPSQEGPAQLPSSGTGGLAPAPQLQPQTSYVITDASSNEPLPATSGNEIPIATIDLQNPSAGVSGTEDYESNNSLLRKTISETSNLIGSFFGIKKSSVIPPSASLIIAASRQNTFDDFTNKWLIPYQFRVWPVEDNLVAVHRSGITAVTRYPVILGVRNLSFKVQTTTGDKKILYYPDSVWAYLSNLHIISEDTHVQPIELIEVNGVMYYYIRGASKQLFLALLPTSVCKKIEVSAYSREVKSIESCTIFDTFVDLFSLRL